ncbi:glycine zipper 2TM domain-containing protein [Steroidobacter sp.]|uniref:glycine zipper 2TM domain-containing protein n=1 Tax=Steroidobacter sp. TaxID=1978227 RepID=UPI0025F30CB4|nr:YMGG-like glycine zipper-containing protein [Steroidobacter sp.]
MAETAAPPPVTQVFVYPTAGQSDAQLDRDRYECHLWAVKQSGYDPGEPRLAPHQRVAVVAGPPPGSAAAGGAVTGAVLGAAVSHPRNAGEGAIAGAVVGAIVGSAVEASREQQVTREVSTSRRQNDAYLERQSDNYRRAIGACLEGRGYSVK